MELLVVGLIGFFAVHSVSIVNRPWRDGMVKTLGAGPWKALYSLIALPSFLLVCYGYGLARAAPHVLYTPPGWMKYPAMLLLLPVFPLLLSVYLPGHLKARARHPMLVATKCWALAHLLVNGTLADVCLFGGFLLWAISDRIAVERRAPQLLILDRHARRNDLFAVLGGLAIYGIFVAGLHLWLIGVSPI